MAEEQARDLRSTIEPGLWVRGAEPLLKRVLVNLVDNAFRHTPSSARIDVVCRRERGDALMEVCDAGSGIDPRVLPDPFERFRHGPGGGSGLGLALVREIVERHGGTVTLDRLDTGGTRARVRLPLLTVPSGRAA
jgi:signal transduction histidine kinase